MRQRWAIYSELAFQSRPCCLASYSQGSALLPSAGITSLQQYAPQPLFIVNFGNGTQASSLQGKLFTDWVTPTHAVLSSKFVISCYSNNRKLIPWTTAKEGPLAYLTCQVSWGQRVSWKPGCLHWLQKLCFPEHSLRMCLSLPLRCVSNRTLLCSFAVYPPSSQYVL